MYKYIYKVGDVCFSSFEEATKVIDKAFKFNKPITIERYKLFESYDDLYDIAVSINKFIPGIKNIIPAYVEISTISNILNRFKIGA